METIPGQTNGILENLIAGGMFWSPNMLMAIPIFRDALAWVLILYNFVIIFILISTMSHFRFNIRYTKKSKPGQSYSQTGEAIKKIVSKAKKLKSNK